MGAQVKNTVISRKNFRPHTSDNAPMSGALRNERIPLMPITRPFIRNVWSGKVWLRTCEHFGWSGWRKNANKEQRLHQVLPHILHYGVMSPQPRREKQPVELYHSITQQCLFVEMPFAPRRHPRITFSRLRKRLPCFHQDFTGVIYYTSMCAGSRKWICLLMNVQDYLHLSRASSADPTRKTPKISQLRHGTR